MGNDEGASEPRSCASARRRTVAHVIESRYGIGPRPLSWDARRPGFDVVETVEGETLRLASTGQQSCPQQGWQILLTGGDSSNGFTWTLYGLAPHADVANA
jgi:hypothetical protein